MAKAVSMPEELEFHPTVHISLQDKDLAAIKEINIGEEVSVVLKGKITSISRHEGKTGVDGHIELEDYSVKVSSTSVFDELSSDEEEEEEPA